MSMLGYLGEFIWLLCFVELFTIDLFASTAVYHFSFSFRSIMSPKCTVHSCNPSARAVQAAASSQPSQKRAKCSSGPSNAAGGPPVASEPSSTRQTSQVETQPSSSPCGSPVATQQSSAVSQVPFLLLTHFTTLLSLQPAQVKTSVALLLAI